MGEISAFHSTHVGSFVSNDHLCRFSFKLTLHKQRTTICPKAIMLRTLSPTPNIFVYYHFQLSDMKLPKLFSVFKKHQRDQPTWLVTSMGPNCCNHCSRPGFALDHHTLGIFPHLTPLKDTNGNAVFAGQRCHEQRRCG